MKTKQGLAARAFSVARTAGANARMLVVGKSAGDWTTVVPTSGPSAWISLLREPFTGAWQRSVPVESPDRQLQFATIYSAVSLIAGDIAKLPLRLTRLVEGVWEETSNPAYSPVLRRPNRYQTKSQFVTAWIVSKLMWGNTYVLKERDQRGVVVALYVLDPHLVKVIVASDGGVYYQVNADTLTTPDGAVIVPATEIIHDRCISPFHPLIGVPPLYAAAIAATQGLKIQNNSSTFFENMSRPSGQLTTDQELGDETANRLKADFEEKFGGANIGRILVGGSGLKFEAMTMPAEQAQLIEQLGWTGEECLRPFHIPPYKVGLGDPPTFNNIGQLAQEYYSTALQVHINDLEETLSFGLGLANDLRADIDEGELLRMDPEARAKYETTLAGAGLLSLDEGRQMENRRPLPGGAGKVPFMQQQNYPVTVLAKRTDVTPSTAVPTPTPAPGNGSTPADAAPQSTSTATPAKTAPGADAHLLDWAQLIKAFDEAADLAIQEDFEHV